MAHFEAKMHQIRFRTSPGSLQRSSRTPDGFHGPTSNGKGGEGKDIDKGKRREELALRIKQWFPHLCHQYQLLLGY